MNYKECARLLADRDNILLVTHKNPDGDTMGSAAALCSALRRKGKTAWLYPNGSVIEKLRPYVAEYYAPEDFEPSYIVSVDVATEKLFAPGFEAQVNLCIDHHPTNSHYTQKELIHSERSSCGEIVLELVKALCGNVARNEADLLYIAISTDTGCFQYSNTNARTLSAAAELLKLGANNSEINLKFFRKISPARMKLEGMIYSGMTFHRGGKVTVATVTKKMMAEAGATENDCDDLAGLAGKAEGSVVSITIREQDDGSSKVSVRSMPQVSSSDICAVFGGGGHAMAAGCSIPCAPEKAKKMLLAVVDEVWK